MCDRSHLLLNYDMSVIKDDYAFCKNIISFVPSFKGIVDIDLHHPKIAYLRNALLVDEEMLPQLKIKVGILGCNRSDYDIMLMPYEPEEPAEPTEIRLLKKSLETRKSIFVPKMVSVLSFKTRT